ncbi:hypothetical protein FB567DRAFT_556740 [Paraphoma chrysanthemicola]|uniref:NAD(P)-binding protein n=1 Tax=Paraphoma chrysanthemicola TaxID=798071 RepID=A0A8K0RKR6_9PLEO|nr:hypothetical protein FB567DRAFT_556740 [Paraphoma chrysanthemicola]
MAAEHTSAGSIDNPKTAYITGGASGIGRALTELLLSRGWHVFISDLNENAARQFSNEYNTTHDSTSLSYAECDTASWESQVSAYQKALVALGGRIDLVAPVAGIGEKKWLISRADSKGQAQGSEFVKPDLAVVDIDLTGVLYTLALAIQQFRRQDPIPWSTSNGDRFRGKIALVASVCGIYDLATMPIYTAAKHALTGLTRSYGKLLPEEHITLNAIAPNVVRTAIGSHTEFFEQLEARNILTPMKGLMEAFSEVIDASTSGEVFECGPRGGWAKRPGMTYLDSESEESCGMLEKVAYGFH